VPLIAWIQPIWAVGAEHAFPLADSCIGRGGPIEGRQRPIGPVQDVEHDAQLLTDPPPSPASAALETGPRDAAQHHRTLLSTAAGAL
jgi:hypothetical protein